MDYPGKKLWPLPKVNDEVLETVKNACLACVNRGGDIFSTCLRQHGATAAQVTSVLHLLIPNISDTEPVSIQRLLDAVEDHQRVSQAA